MSWALPLMLVKLSGLSVRQVQRWVAEKQLPIVCSSQNRALEACLVAVRGYGVIFLDGRDAADRQRFALAHEIAHFLVDYFEPRRRALDSLGEGVLEVLEIRTTHFLVNVDGTNVADVIQAIVIVICHRLIQPLSCTSPFHSK